jgi:hypothetical protein
MLIHRFVSRTVLSSRYGRGMLVKSNWLHAGINMFSVTLGFHPNERKTSEPELILVVLLRLYLIYRCCCTTKRDLRYYVYIYIYLFIHIYIYIYIIYILYTQKTKYYGTGVINGLGSTWSCANHNARGGGVQLWHGHSVGQTFACVSQFHLWFTAGVFLKVPTSSQLKCRRRGEASVLVPGSANSSFSSELLCSWAPVEFKWVSFMFVSGWCS